MPTLIAALLNEEELEKQIENASKLIGLEKEAKIAKTIFIKPNLTYPTYKKGVTTRVEMVRALVAVLVKINPGLKLYIGEGEGGYNSFSMTDAMRNMGFMDIEKEFSQVEVLNLSKIPAQEISIDTKRGLYQLDLPKIFFNEIDFSISCPLPKVHCMTKVTLSFKNQWGCLPDTLRLKNHYMFPHIIAKISDVLKFKYAILDGKFGLDRYGPMDGDPIELNWFVASNSLGAFDMIVSEMMGFDWRKVHHLRETAQYGFMPKQENVNVIGDIQSLKRKLKLTRNFWTYPALMAFHSRILTYFFYLSNWADPLHKIMYAFRKKPID